MMIIYQNPALKLTTCRVSVVKVTMTRSPSQEAEMVISGKEFGLGEEYVKPLMEVCFSRESSGKDLRQVTAFRERFC